MTLQEHVDEYKAKVAGWTRAMTPVYFEYEIDGELSDGEFSGPEKAQNYAENWFGEYHADMNGGEYSSKEVTAYVVALDEDKKELYREEFQLSWEA